MPGLTYREAVLATRCEQLHSSAGLTGPLKPATAQSNLLTHDDLKGSDAGNHPDWLKLVASSRQEVLTIDAQSITTYMP